ncbi:MAG: HD domain-containing protein [Treponema sp.]|nr:HD domain-containing protein [Treponema sp.]
MDFLRQHQLSIMLFLSGTCSVLAILSFFTRSMPKKRRTALMLMEFYAACLLIMDRLAYIYRGNISTLGWYMVRITNFSVFLFSLCIIHAYTLYLVDLITHEVGLKKTPHRLIICEILFAIGIMSLVLGHFTGFYYFFDNHNRYQRGPGFLISYIFPFVIMVIQLSVIVQFYKKIARNIRIPLLIFSLLPFVSTVIQFFSYGLSLQNISLVGVAVLLYIFVILDMNRTVEKATKREVEFLKSEQKNAKIMFDQTATALANAIDAKDQYTHGHSMRVAEYSQKIARAAGKDEKYCEDIYYAGLLHDVGKIGVPGYIINKNGKLTDEEFAEIKKHPTIGRQILSSISKSPYLSIAANSHHERYDGHGYPEGLKGEDIPEIARIIAVADAYDAMTSKRSYRDPIPQQKVREEIVKGMGAQFDPAFAKIMLHIIDLDTEYELKEHDNISDISGKRELHCESLRSEKSEGLLISDHITKIQIHSQSDKENFSKNSIPSLILFDSLDARIHQTPEKQKDLLYMEYAILHFDGNSIQGDVRKIQTELVSDSKASEAEILTTYQKGLDYNIEAVKYKDHLLITIANKFTSYKFIIALNDASHYTYLALTGQNCTLSNFEVVNDKDPIDKNYIPRIAPETSYINGPEGDLPNIQIDGWRTNASKGIPIKNNMEISFHTQSLPTARLIWHCPFISLFYSDNQMIGGPNFREFVLIRIDGENWESYDWSKNTIIINKNETFEGWESWKALNKAGMDCHVSIKREGQKITVFTENAGIAVRSVSILSEDQPTVYAALTGDQCAITNIRIKE